MKLWREMANGMDFSSFKTVHDYSKDDALLKKELSQVTRNHLENLCKRLEGYFGDYLKKTGHLAWLASPFTTSLVTIVSSRVPFPVAQ